MSASTHGDGEAATRPPGAVLRAAAAGAGLLVLAGAGAAAQETIYVGRGGTQPRVEFNPEALGGSGPLPGPSAAAGGARLLRPPPAEAPRSRLTVGREAADRAPGAGERRTAERRAGEPVSRLLAPEPEGEGEAAAAQPERQAAARAEPEHEPQAGEPAAAAAPEVPEAPQTAEEMAAADADLQAETPEPTVPDEMPAADEQAEEPAAETQTAARTQATGAFEEVRLNFAADSAELPTEARRRLDALAERMRRDEGLRIQLLAYAHGTEDTASRARRLSLSRALAVRSFLIDRGIRSTRMDVRALGNQAADGPADRVDIVAAER